MSNCTEVDFSKTKNILSVKIRIIPTQEQEVYLRKACGTARFVYNTALSITEDIYIKTGKHISWQDISTEYLTPLKQQEEFRWLNDVCSQIPQGALRDLDNAYKRFYRGLSSKPKYKSKKNSKMSFHIRENGFKLHKNHIKISKLKDDIALSGNTRGIEKYTGKYINPRISYDGKFWYVSVGILIRRVENNSGGIVGIDLGIKELAYCSNGVVFHNINKTKRVKHIENRLKRLKRQVSKKYEMNKQGNKYVKTSNIAKLEKTIALTERRLANIRNTYIHECTSKIVKTKPSMIVLEDLQVSKMLKNRYLADSIRKQCFYKFRQYITYKAYFNCIRVVIADKHYKSTQTCSCCGNVQKMRLFDRVFKCNKCHNSLDRDYNSSKNLEKLGVSMC